MDRRSWLWRKKSSEKSPGETESSGSISSHSERFSDEQANLTHNIQSPEITSKAAPDYEENENIKSLTEKLSAALLSVSANEELVKQHAKVAEEAVAGWEKAEREVSVLKLQLDAAMKKNSALEDRVSHLDGALKECVRQLRQGREEQDQKIEKAIAKRACEWESRKSELETQLSELRAQLETAKSEATATMNGLHPKLEAAEKENTCLRLELVALSKKLEVRTLERDLSTQTAETASKQHLESIKKVSKLEGRLKLLTYKACSHNDHRSFTGSSVYVDSLADSQSDYGERLHALETEVKGEQGPGRNPACSSEIVLMDDFLEMERMAALPKTENGSVSLELGGLSGKVGGENPLKAEIEAMINRNGELEKKIEKLEAEKMELEMALNESQSQLTECQAQLKTSQGQLNATKTDLIRLRHQLFECQDQLRTSQDKLKGMETELIELQTQLIERDDQLNASKGHLKDAEAKLKELHNQLIEREDQLNNSQGQLKDAEAKLVEVQAQLTEHQDKLVELHTELALANKLKEVLEGELQASNARREEAELQVKAPESETKSLQAKVDSLLDQADKERALSAGITAKCHRLEDELSRRKLEPQFQCEWRCNADMKAEQEKELELAASKLADCQKTIASLGRQLQSLATLDNFLVDADDSVEFSGESSIFSRAGELGSLPSIDCK